MRLPKSRIPIEPSKILEKYAKEIATQSPGLIVDVACGYGRNAILLSSYSVPVLCVDINQDALSYIESLSSSRLQDCSALKTQNLDLANDPWPFEKESIGAIINVHFFTPNLLDNCLRSLKIGGYLFIETIDGHGGNYLHLPPQGFIQKKLADAFDIKFIKEKKVGPPQCNASSIKLFAQKFRRL